MRKNHGRTYEITFIKGILKTLDFDLALEKCPKVSIKYPKQLKKLP